jgi:MarR family transcriptional regulator for hemolysin
VNYLSRYYQAYLDNETAAFGITGAQVPLLAYLWEGHTGDTQNEIARQLGVDKGTISRNVQALSRAGLLVQNVSPTDSRACSVELTQAGWDLAEPVTAVMQRWTTAVTADLDDDTKQLVLRSLQAMTRRSEEILTTSRTGLVAQPIVPGLPLSMPSELDGQPLPESNLAETPAIAEASGAGSAAGDSVEA